MSFREFEALVATVRVARLVPPRNWDDGPDGADSPARPEHPPGNHGAGALPDRPVARDLLGQALTFARP